MVGWIVNEDSTVYFKEFNNLKVVCTQKKHKEVYDVIGYDGDTEQVTELGTSPFDETRFNTLAINFFTSQSVTVADLMEQYNSLKYFDQDLNPRDGDLLIEAYRDENLRTQMLLEMIFVNKVQTISRNYEWEAMYVDRPFHQKMFKRKIMESEADEFGNIKGFGMKFTQKEWNVYQEFHDQIFKIDTIDIT